MDARSGPRGRTFSSSTGFASLTSATSNVAPAQEVNHVHRRWFIGPLPEKVIIPVSDDDASAKGKRDISQLIKDHALNFFLQEGGRLEDWGETSELTTREEMLQKWRESEWAAVLSRRRNAKRKDQPTQRWVGNSFEVGDFVGVNVLAAQSSEALMSGVSSHKGLSELHLPSLFDQVESVDWPSAKDTTETFMTARSEPPDSDLKAEDSDAQVDIPSRIDSPTQEAGPSSVGFIDLSHVTTEETMPESVQSTTVLIDQTTVSPHPSSSLSRARSEIVHRPIIKKSNLHQSDSVAILASSSSPSKDKGKFKVHYADKPVLSPIPEPAPVTEVLQRSGDDVFSTSAGAMSTDAADVDAGVTANWGDVVLRDRMLVRVSYSKSEAVGLRFDEYQSRMTSGLHHAEWAEFLVAWRGDQIELYENYSIPGKERLTGHKHLAFVVPLKSARTRLSLYSFVDMTFCLTCPPTPTTGRRRKSRGLFQMSKQGTNIFVFKVKTRSRALDWIWQLWRHTGGQLPTMIEVHNPSLDSKVRIDVPHISTVDSDRMFTRANIIRLCIESLHHVPDWQEIVERQMHGGKVLELAWRIDTNLDWIWLERDVYGLHRAWAVLCGLALKQAHLEIRLGDHYPNKVPNPRQGDEEPPFIPEPPSIEGYVERIKPHTNIRQSVYLSTHDGNLFLLQHGNAHPPSPFLSEEDEATKDGRTPLRDREVARGMDQIKDAVGVTDLRSILLVRRASAPVPNNVHSEQPPRTDEDWANIWAASAIVPEEGDHADEGGEEALNKHENKQHVRMRRSFELLLTSGHVVRFECHSCRNALEWIGRLRALIAYWTLRHKGDAKDEMEVASARRPRLTPRQHIHALEEELPPLPPPDPAAPLPALANMYNWCVLQGCKSIIRGGKVHMRRGLHGQYRTVQMFLVSGTLVMFRVRPQSAVHLTMKAKKRVNLADAYVASGYFAVLALPNGQYDPEVNSVPRHYQDGLETDDPEEDTLFMISYRPKSADIPALSAKRKLVVFRTRSKLERDTWCWALNTEIERLARAQKDREVLLRDSGALKDW